MTSSSTLFSGGFIANENSFSVKKNEFSDFCSALLINGFSLLVSFYVKNHNNIVLNTRRQEIQVSLTSRNIIKAKEIMSTLIVLTWKEDFFFFQCKTLLWSKTTASKGKPYIKVVKHNFFRDLLNWKSYTDSAPEIREEMRKSGNGWRIGSYLPIVSPSLSYQSKQFNNFWFLAQNSFPNQQMELKNS